MIRRLAAVGMVFATFASAAAADCKSELDFVTGVLEPDGFRVAEAGDASEVAGRCRLTGVVLVENVIRMEIEEITWILNGLEALESGDGAVELDFDLSNLRIVPLTSDRWVDYMMREQSRRNLIDARLRASWDFGRGVFALNELEIDLPGKNSFSLSSRTEGMSRELLSGGFGSLATVSLAQMELEIENHGYLDGLILGYLVGYFADTPGSPKTVVDATKQEALTWVAELPDAAFPAASKAALEALIDDAPVPWGTFAMSIQPDAPIALARLPGMGFAAGLAEPMTLDDALAGAFVEIRFDPSEGIE